MAIISASRRTDIPTYYSEWFLNRLKAGNIMIRNSYNNKVTNILFNKEDIDCIVFWTKNPYPMLKRIEEFSEYVYYFQFTLTGYGKDIEANLPDKDFLIQTFKDLYNKGNGHIIWRYDPIVFTKNYTPEWHLNTFKKIANELKSYTKKCVISFVDMYNYINMDTNIIQLSKENLTHFCKELADIARNCGMTMATCSEEIDLEYCGITHNKCVDDEYISEITGKHFNLKKDASQRKACGCIESIDIGTYNTCKNGCKYCYACKNKNLLEICTNKYDVNSPLLCGNLLDGETYYEKKISPSFSIVDEDQLTLF